MPKRSEYLEYLLELLHPLGSITARAMFGGFGIYRDGIIFAIVIADTLYFKTIAANQNDYTAAGSQPFTYRKRNGKTYTLSYWEVPLEVIEDQDTLLIWARKAHANSLKQQQ